MSHEAESAAPGGRPGSLSQVPAPSKTWAEAIPCARCGQPALMRCVDAGGGRRDPHRERVTAAREAGHAPRRGRPRSIEGGEQARLTVRLGAPHVEAIAAYLELHPEVKGDQADAVRGILEEWAEDRA